MVFQAKSVIVSKYDCVENSADVYIKKEINIEETDLSIADNVNNKDNANTRDESKDNVIKLTSEKTAKSKVKKSQNKCKNKKENISAPSREDENIEEIKTAGVIADEINEAAAADIVTDSKFQQFKVKCNLLCICFIIYDYQTVKRISTKIIILTFPYQIMLTFYLTRMSTFIKTKFKTSRNHMIRQILTNIE